MKATSGSAKRGYICFALSLALSCGMLFTGSGCSAETKSGETKAYETGSSSETRQTVETKPAADAPREAAEPADADSATAPERPDKIEDRLWEIMETTEDSELIPVSIWIAGIDFEEVEKRVEAEVGLSREIIDQKSKAQAKHLDADVQTYIAAQRSIAKEMTVESNRSFIETFLSGAEEVCAYEFFPMIDCSVTKEKILCLASLGDVEAVSSNADKDAVYQDYLIDAADPMVDPEAVPVSIGAES